MIHLTIDEKRVRAKKGETVLEVARRKGVYIPTLCNQEGLTPYGGCRLCIVEVAGWRLPTAACTLPVQEGMVVRTDSPKLRRLRRFTLQLILSEHPYACLVCDKNNECRDYQKCIEKSSIAFGCRFCARDGDCELQKLVEYLGIKEIPYAFHYRNLEVERGDPFFDRDYNICILCGRCIRVCQEVRKAAVLDFQHRGPETMVGTAFNIPHLDIGCQFCGACVDVCPTGALRQRYAKWDGPVSRSIKSRCALCSIGCSINLDIADKRIVGSRPQKDQLCVRGRFGIAPLVHHQRRGAVPLLKKADRVVEVAWPEAIKEAAARLEEHKGKVGILFSPQVTLEAIDAIYDLAGHFSASHFSASLVLAKGIKSLDPGDFPADAVFVVMNTDLVSDYAPLLLRLKSRVNKNHRFIAIDGLRNRFADTADLWLRPHTGKEADVLNLLYQKKTSKNNTGVDRAGLEQARALIKGKKVFLLYNPANVALTKIPTSVQALPLPSQINTLEIHRRGLGCRVEDLLNNEDIDCLYIIGAAPELRRRYKTIIVQDSFRPDLDCDIFLPAATFAETSGSFIDIEGRRRRLNRGLAPVGKAKTDEEIFAELTQSLGLKGRSVKYRTRQYPRRREPGLSRQYPYRLLVRENCYTHRGTALASFVKGFARLRHDDCLWVAPGIAERLRLHNGDKVTVVGSGMRLSMPVFVSDTLPDDCVLIQTSPATVVEGQPVRLEKDNNRQEKR